MSGFQNGILGNFYSLCRDTLIRNKIIPNPPPPHCYYLDNTEAIWINWRKVNISNFSLCSSNIPKLFYLWFYTLSYLKKLQLSMNTVSMEASTQSVACSAYLGMTSCHTLRRWDLIVQISSDKWSAVFFCVFHW